MTQGLEDFQTCPMVPGPIHRCCYDVLKASTIPRLTFRTSQERYRWIIFDSRAGVAAGVLFRLPLRPGSQSPSWPLHRVEPPAGPPARSPHPHAGAGRARPARDRQLQNDSGSPGALGEENHRSRLSRGKGRKLVTIDSYALISSRKLPRYRARDVRNERPVRDGHHRRDSR